MRPIVQPVQCNCNPQCNGVLRVYAPFRGLDPTPALGRVTAMHCAKESAIATPPTFAVARALNRSPTPGAGAEPKARSAE
jgi:hypothetical protein